MTKTWLMRRPVRKSGLALHHLRKQFIGVQAPLHEEIGLAGANELDRLLGGGLAMRHVDDLDVAEV